MAFYGGNFGRRKTVSSQNTNDAFSTNQQIPPAATTAAAHNNQSRNPFSSGRHVAQQQQSGGIPFYSADLIDFSNSQLSTERLLHVQKVIDQQHATYMAYIQQKAQHAMMQQANNAGYDENNASVQYSDTVISSFVSQLLFCGCGMTLDQGMFIAHILHSNQTIKFLNLSGNDLGNLSIAHIAELIKMNSSIQSLSLRANLLSVRNIVEIGREGLSFNKTLLELNLGHNLLGDEGITALMTCLRQNTTLLSLFLDSNNISDNACEVIGQTLHPGFSQCRLKHIRLENNLLGESGTEVIASYIADSAILETIQFSHFAIYVQELRNLNRQVDFKAVIDGFKQKKNLSEGRVLNLPFHPPNNGLGNVSSSVGTNSLSTNVSKFHPSSFESSSSAASASSKVNHYLDVIASFILIGRKDEVFYTDKPHHQDQEEDTTDGGSGGAVSTRVGSHNSGKGDELEGREEADNLKLQEIFDEQQWGFPTSYHKYINSLRRNNDANYDGNEDDGAQWKGINPALLTTALSESTSSITKKHQNHLNSKGGVLKFSRKIQVMNMNESCLSGFDSTGRGSRVIRPSFLLGQLIKHSKACQNLKVLTLANNHLAFNEILSLMEGLRFCSTLKVLDLSHNSLDSQAGTLLCNVLSSYHAEAEGNSSSSPSSQPFGLPTQLVELNLSNNPYLFTGLTSGMKWGKMLCAKLGPRKLKELVLMNTGISEENTVEMFRQMSSNSHQQQHSFRPFWPISFLDLRGNRGVTRSAKKLLATALSNYAASLLRGFQFPPQNTNRTMNSSGGGGGGRSGSDQRGTTAANSFEDGFNSPRWGLGCMWTRTDISSSNSGYSIASDESNDLDVSAGTKDEGGVFNDCGRFRFCGFACDNFCLKANMVHMDASNSELCREDALLISELLRHHRSLRCLILDNNPNIGDEGCLYIARGVCHNISVERLSLNNCQCGALGAQALYELSFRKLGTVVRVMQGNEQTIPSKYAKLLKAKELEKPFSIQFEQPVGSLHAAKSNPFARKGSGAEVVSDIRQKRTPEGNVKPVNPFIQGHRSSQSEQVQVSTSTALVQNLSKKTGYPVSGEGGGYVKRACRVHVLGDDNSGRRTLVESLGQMTNKKGKRSSGGSLVSLIQSSNKSSSNELLSSWWSSHTESSATNMMLTIVSLIIKSTFPSSSYNSTPSRAAFGNSSTSANSFNSSSNNNSFNDNDSSTSMDEQEHEEQWERWQEEYQARQREQQQQQQQDSTNNTSQRSALPDLYVVPPIVLDDKGNVANNTSSAGAGNGGLLSSISSAFSSSSNTATTPTITSSTVLWVHNVNNSSFENKSKETSSGSSVLTLEWLRSWSNAIFIIVVDLCESKARQESSIIKHLKLIQASGCHRVESIILVGTKSDQVSNKLDVEFYLDSLKDSVVSKLEMEAVRKSGFGDLFGPPPPITSACAVDAIDSQGSTMQQLRKQISTEQMRIDQKVQVKSSLQTKYVVNLLCKWAREPWIPFDIDQDTHASNTNSTSPSSSSLFDPFYSNWKNKNAGSGGSSNSTKNRASEGRAFFETPIVNAKELLFRYKLEVFAGIQPEEIISILKSLHKLGKVLIIYKKKNMIRNFYQGTNQEEGNVDDEEDDVADIGSMYVILNEIWFMRHVVCPISTLSINPMPLLRTYSIISTFAIGSNQPRVYHTICRNILDILLILNYAVIVNDKCLFMPGQRSMPAQPKHPAVLKRQEQKAMKRARLQAKIALKESKKKKKNDPLLLKREKSDESDSVGMCEGSVSASSLLISTSGKKGDDAGSIEGNGSYSSFGIGGGAGGSGLIVISPDEKPKKRNPFATQSKAANENQEQKSSSTPSATNTAADGISKLSITKKASTTTATSVVIASTVMVNPTIPSPKDSDKQPIHLGVLTATLDDDSENDERDDEDEKEEEDGEDDDDDDVVAVVTAEVEQCDSESDVGSVDESEKNHNDDYDDKEGEEDDDNKEEEEDDDEEEDDEEDDVFDEDDEAFSAIEEDSVLLSCRYVLESPLTQAGGGGAIQDTTWRLLLAHVISTLSPPHPMFFHEDTTRCGSQLFNGGGMSNRTYRLSGGAESEETFESEIQLFSDALLIKGLVLGDSKAFVTSDTYGVDRVRADVMVQLVDMKDDTEDGTSSTCSLSSSLSNIDISIKVYNMSYTTIVPKLFDKVKLIVTSFLEKERMIHVRVKTVTQGYPNIWDSDPAERLVSLRG